MRKLFKFAVPAVAGAVWTSAAVLISRLLIRNLGILFQRCGVLSGLTERTIAHGVQILTQLKSAAIVSPWFAAVLAGMLLGVLTALLIRRRGWRIALSVLLFVPAVLLCIWFTEVNAIRVSALLKRVLPVIPELL